MINAKQEIGIILQKKTVFIEIDGIEVSEFLQNYKCQYIFNFS